MVARPQGSCVIAMADGYESDEDAGEGRFGREFADVEFQSNAAVAVLLDTILERDAEHKEAESALLKSLKYAQTFPGAVGSAAHSAEAAGVVTRALADFAFIDEEGNEKKLSKYEVVALANLNPDKAREAMVHVPSLSRFEEKEVEEIVSTLRAAANTR